MATTEILVQGADGEINTLDTADVGGTKRRPKHEVAASVLPTGAATETSLAAVLAKIVAAPATEATIAAVLAKLSAVNLGPDALNGVLKSIKCTLSATPGTLTTITLPDNAQGFRLYPATSDIRFAIGENPAAEATDTDGTVAAADFAVGAIAKADQWETRLLAAGTARTLRLRSATASVVVEVGVF